MLSQVIQPLLFFLKCHALFLFSFLGSFELFPLVCNFYLTFSLQSEFHVVEEVKIFLHRLYISRVLPRLLLPEKPLNDHGCLGGLLKLGSIVPFLDQASVPLLDNLDLVEHLLDLPDANRRKLPDLASVSPPSLKLLRCLVLFQVYQYLVLFLENIADRHNYELIDTKLEIMLDLLDLLDRFVLKSDIPALLRHSKLLFLQALQVRLHPYAPKRCCKQA